MKLLFVSFYYAPDLSAGSFRATALVSALLASRPDLEIEVITTQPNRYEGFGERLPEVEETERLTVRRIQMPSHQSGMLDQARAFAVFAREMERLTRNHAYDLIFATSSRLMTAAMASRLSRRLDVPLYLDIRDIFVDTIKDILPSHVAMVTKPIFDLLERWTMSRAGHINLVSGGFEAYFAGRYPGKSVSYFTNGVDEDFIRHNFTGNAPDRARTVRVLYAGNIGEGQGLQSIIPELAQRMQGRCQFRILGGGGRRAALEAALDALAVANVTLLPPVAREQLIAEYQEADVLFLHLNDYEAFEKVLPSKLFEYAATGKPIWAGIGGYSAKFAQEEIENVTLFPPCDAEGAEAAFARLNLGMTDRSPFVSKYARSAIMARMAQHILSFARA